MRNQKYHFSRTDPFRSTFNPSPVISCRLLTPEDTAICRSFTTALSAAEIDQSGFDSRETPAFGAFASGVLCAIASYQIWEPRIAHITVATHPDYRRHGFGRVAVSALAEDAFARNLILQKGLTRRHCDREPASP
jgi:ribosomal protein S18 acetylase RimI-like enzyme